MLIISNRAPVLLALYCCTHSEDGEPSTVRKLVQEHKQMRDE